MITGLDHVNLQTAQLDAMVAWYEQMLQLRQGDRPEGGSRGAWLYAGDRAVVHLTEVAEAPPATKRPRLEHAAFRARGLPEFVERLTSAAERYSLVPLPALSLVLVNVWDPDGNHMHVDFPASEAEGIDLTA